MHEQPDPVVADTPEAFTARWIEAALRAGGLDARVEAVTSISPAGTGQMASCFRITLRGNAETPTSVVAKVAAPNASKMAANGYRTEPRRARSCTATIGSTTACTARIPRSASPSTGRPLALAWACAATIWPTSSRRGSTPSYGGAQSANSSRPTASGCGTRCQSRRCGALGRPPIRTGSRCHGHRARSGRGIADRTGRRHVHGHGISRVLGDS